MSPAAGVQVVNRGTVSDAPPEVITVSRLPTTADT